MLRLLVRMRLFATGENSHVSQNRRDMGQARHGAPTGAGFSPARLEGLEVWGAGYLYSFRGANADWEVRRVARFAHCGRYGCGCGQGGGGAGGGLGCPNRLGDFWLGAAGAMW